MHLVRTGGWEAHQLAGTQGCSVYFVTVSKSLRRSAAPPRQHDSHHLHNKDGRNPLPLFVQGEPSVVVSSHQEESHSSPPFVDFHIGEHRTGFPQQRWDFKLSPSVLEDLLETTSLAHPGCLRVQWESSGSQVHDLGAKFQVNSNRCPVLLLGSSNPVFPTGSPHSSSTRGGSRAAN